jgi:UDP:flavonoid glycosyltransferase YjiC (YdhE family)
MKMVTVLVCSLPIYGHHFQLMKIAQALRQHNITVVVLMDTGFENHLRDAGFASIIVPVKFEPEGGVLEDPEYVMHSTEETWEALQVAIQNTSFDAVLYDHFCIWGFYLAKLRKVPAITLTTCISFNSENFIREFNLADKDQFLASP